MTATPSYDHRVRRFSLPTRVVWQTDGNTAPEQSEVLLTNDLGQAALASLPMCRLRHHGSVLLDFGKELHGGVQLVTGYNEGRTTAVRVRFGESVSEAMSEPNNDHAIHDQHCLLPMLGATEIGNTGFRFVRIDMLEEDATLELVAVRAVELLREMPYLGSFHSSDERLNAIWQTGAYTVHLCMQDYLWDGIKRDRLVWIGDMHPETMVVNTVFGEQEVVPRSLDFIRDLTPADGWMNGISSYSLWWIFIQHSWYLYHGNHAYLQGQAAYLTTLLQRLLTYVGSDGKECLDGVRFLDWPSNEYPQAIDAGLQALLLLALQAGAELCEYLQADALAKQCRAAVALMRTHVPSLEGINKSAASLLALSGLHDAGEINRQLLASEPFSGLSTFYGYYILQARALAGDIAGGLETIRRYWGGMLDVGATTFWEHFDLSWLENAGRIDELVPEGKADIHADYGAYCFVGLRHSLCHGWAAGPTAWLTEHVLGLKPLAPGCARLQVRPQLGDLDFVEGSFPTPLGQVMVRHEKDAAGHIHTAIDAPAQIKLER